MPAEPGSEPRASGGDPIRAGKPHGHGDTKHRQREPTENARPPEHTNHGNGRGERGTSRRGHSDHETNIRKTKAPTTPPNHEKSHPNPEKSRPNRKKEAPQKHPKATPTRSEGHAQGGCQTQKPPAPTTPPTKRSSTPHQGKQHPQPRGTAHTPKKRSPRPTDREPHRTPPISEIARPPRHKLNAKTNNRAGAAGGTAARWAGRLVEVVRWKSDQTFRRTAPLEVCRQPTYFHGMFVKEVCVSEPGTRA